MLVFEDISIRVQQHPLLECTGLQIHTGEKAVLRGSSGCGKSSLLKSTVGAIPLSRGVIRVNNIELSAATVSEIRSQIAYIGQEPILGAEQVREALWLPFQFKAHRGNEPDPKHLSQLLERLHLSGDILDKPCNRISGGEKQRIAIVRALLLGKTIFLADEVTSALDPDSKAAVMAELFRSEITLLSVSHDPEWSQACSQAYTIVNKQIREDSE